MPRLSDYVAKQQLQQQAAPVHRHSSSKETGLDAAAAAPKVAPTIAATPSPKPVAAAAATAASAPAAPAAAPSSGAGPSASAAAAPWQPLYERYVEQYRRRHVAVDDWCSLVNTGGGDVMGWEACAYMHPRVRDRGPRTYRHPDGSLRPDPPVADMYSQANRAHWAELVGYCRTHGGDRDYDTQGRSCRGCRCEHPLHLLSEFSLPGWVLPFFGHGVWAQGEKLASFSLRYGIGVPPEAHQKLLEALDLLEELTPPPAELLQNERRGDPLADPEHPFNREWQQLAEQVFAAASARGQMKPHLGGVGWQEMCEGAIKKGIFGRLFGFKKKKKTKGLPPNIDKTQSWDTPKLHGAIP
ncbi:hypothetical protein VOLCADRAFT_89814 [Volvox carteri f. nagariensis]|uniref:Uncharacterized protein n=1 Tax=Volvox carteri f. nagariensis TaxID=3068 RepID=D8TSQ3_VOLCA|nr:uncharacterized protein VOLCADRAFT_89814 [Volvox carteri f. nagariensis]EFJ49527.1 hypothetical protein VOLCADRAFT_89814 [Volvox carteri f. nagariensis]|eukprot:XP_002949508.1 hypothetical protein VOLCADRAFT_89814 [Volvox carteri f. nagariensis]